MYSSYDETKVDSSDSCSDNIEAQGEFSLQSQNAVYSSSSCIVTQYDIIGHYQSFMLMRLGVVLMLNKLINKVQITIKCTNLNNEKAVLSQR